MNISKYWIKPAALPKVKVGDVVYTPLGKGKVIRLFQDGTVCVEFEHGGGQVFMLHEVYPAFVQIDIPVSQRRSNVVPMGVLSCSE